MFYFALLFVLSFLTGCAHKSQWEHLPVGVKAGQVVAATGATGFVFFGDSGLGNADQKRVAEGVEHFCNHHTCHFGLLLGDNIYPSGVESVEDEQFISKFERPYKPLRLVFRVVLGNHDHEGNTLAQHQYSSRSSWWDLPGRYYRFREGPVEFFGLDTEQLDSDQLVWLEAQLENSNANWKVVYGHHPVFSYGKHGNTDELVEKLLPILKNRADFYLSGHDHSKQVLTLTQKQGNLTFVVSGAASETTQVSSGEGAVFASQRLGFGHLSFAEKKAELKMLNEKGEVEFTYRISRSRPAGENSLRQSP